VEGIPEKEPLRLECEHFLQCITGGQTPITDGMEGLRVLRILNASQRSLDQNGDKIILKSWMGKGHQGTSPTAPYFAHSTAVVDENVTIAPGCKIWHFSHILSGSKIGERCQIGQNVVIGPDVSIGNDCKIQNNVSVYKWVTLEDGVFCGPSVVFTNVYNPRAEIRKMSEARPTLVKRGATIGANATIVCGTVIGRYAFVGAGALVIRSVPDYALVVGNPAGQIGWVCRCGEHLSMDLQCTHCGKRYRKNLDGIDEEKDS
jgi:UDP-2-acetamido-3-amino-2,3-dideoxy-glucuronate N-acetyltransferase